MNHKYTQTNKLQLNATNAKFYHKWYTMVTINKLSATY